jgi:hypothetical protein
LLLKQEGVPVCDVDVSTRESDGRVVVALVFSLHACVAAAADSAQFSRAAGRSALAAT